MKKIFIIALTAAFTALSANAQESKKQCCGNCEFTPSWFVNFQGGVQIPYSAGHLSDLISPAWSLNVGRNINRYVSARLGIEGVNSKVQGAYDTEAGEYTYNSFKYATGSFDAMLDMVSVFSKKPHAVNFYLLGGVGLNWSGAKTTTSSHFSPNLRLGAQLNAQVAKNVALNLEYRADNTNDQFNGKIKTTGHHDWYSSIYLGVSLVLPDSKSKVIVKDNTDEINALNKRINELQTENEALKNRPAQIKEVTKTVVEKEVVLPNVIFNFDKSNITKQQKANVKSIADYMKANPDTKVTITGYASPEGNKDYNQKLSEKRAQAVADMLVKKYGISADRITTAGGGATSDIYPETELNRVAVTIAK